MTGVGKVERLDLPLSLVTHHRFYAEAEAMGLSGVRVYRMGPCQVFVSLDPSEDGAGRWHLSISCRDRLPTWEEVREARYRCLPGAVTMAMLLPPEATYVNLNPFVFHLHETRDVDADTRVAALRAAERRLA